MSAHDPRIQTDWYGNNWAECSCGWRSDNLRNPTEAKLAHTEHAPSTTEAGDDGE